VRAAARAFLLATIATRAVDDALSVLVLCWKAPRSLRYCSTMSTECQVAVAGGELRVWGKGSGPPVLVLHGGPGLSDYTGVLVGELEDAFTVYRYQQRGLAPSTTSGPFDIETHVADAVAVLDGIGVGGAYVVGHSWGGHLAMYLAALHPDRLLGLVSVDPLGAVPDGGEADLERILTERIPPEGIAKALEIDRRAMAGEGTPDDALESLAIVWPGYFSSLATAPPMPAMAMSIPCYAGTFDSIHEQFARGTLQRLLPGIQVPSFFLLGADSPIPPRHGIASAALIPDARYEVLDDCGHFLWLESPGSVRRAVDAVAACS
jgi:proline iminopeptidase